MVLQCAGADFGVRHMRKDEAATEHLTGFGLWLRVTRLQKGLDQTDLAVRGGFSQGYVSDLEKGKSLPKPKMQAKLATGLGVSLATIQQAIRAAEDGEEFTYDTSPTKSTRVAEPSLPFGAEVLPKSPVVQVPLIARVLSGIPLFSQENIERLVEIDSAMVVEQLITYTIVVGNDNMIGAGIFPGDQLVVRQAETAQDGDIVIIDDGSTKPAVCRLRINGDVMSVYAEPSLKKPILLALEKWKVIGRVGYVVRKL